MTSVFDLIVIGAGPAGMAAAATAADGGAQVLLLDEQRQAGGQIYRNVANQKTNPEYLGKEYPSGKVLVDKLENKNIKTEFGATVWRIDDGHGVVWSRDGQSQKSSAPHILLAGGAQERPMPFPGWTNPGVMSAGAAQILMKSSGLLPRNAILAGSGPLLYLTATQLINAGAPPQALVETQTTSMMLKASRFLPSALLSTSTLFKGLGLIARIRAAGVRRYVGATDFRAENTHEGNVDFSFKVKGQIHTLSTPLLLTHQGVVPSTHISRSAGVKHKWNAQQHAYQPVVDEWGQTDVSGIHIAGDGSGIGGAEVAEAAGRLTANNILLQLGKFTTEMRNSKSVVHGKALSRAQAIRPFLDALYAPRPEFSSPSDDTIVCRCEEVTAGQIRNSISDGANGVRQVKTAVRAGMGPCQGRMCDLTVRGILVACGEKPDTPRARTPVKPIKLGELAALSTELKAST